MSTLAPKDQLAAIEQLASEPGSWHLAPKGKFNAIGPVVFYLAEDETVLGLIRC